MSSSPGGPAVIEKGWVALPAGDASASREAFERAVAEAESGGGTTRPFIQR